MGKGIFSLITNLIKSILTLGVVKQCVGLETKHRKRDLEVSKHRQKVIFNNRVPFNSRNYQALFLIRI